MTKRERKIAELKRNGESEGRIAAIMRGWDQADARFKARKKK